MGRFALRRMSRIVAHSAIHQRTAANRRSGLLLGV